MLSTQQLMLLGRLVEALRADDRISAIWAEGSMARGEADRYSDIDLHALAEGEGAPAVIADLPAILAAAGTVVLLRTVPGTTITTGVMDDGLRFDVVLESAQDLKRLRGAFQALYERRPGDLAELTKRTQPVAPQAERVTLAVAEFWRCIGLLPAVLGRGELLVACQGHGLMVGMAAEIVMASEGKARQTGAKRLNQLLPDGVREQLEAAIPAGAGAQAIATAQHRLARIVAEHGRHCAQRYGFAYPEDLERAVLTYTAAELTLLGITFRNA